MSDHYFPINNFHCNLQLMPWWRRALQVVAGSLGVNLRWLLLSPRFHFGTLLQRVLWSKLSERQRGERAKEGERERERAGESEKERIGKTSALLNMSAALRYPVTKASALIKLCLLPQQHSARLFWHLNRTFYYSIPFIRRQPREDYSEITGYIMT